MPIALDLITHKNLILIKQIYQRAAVQSAAEHSDVDQILALISFDLANETLLKNAVAAVDSRAKIVSDLTELIKTADEVFSRSMPAIPPVPDAQKLRRVRKIRNAAMHDATYPTAPDVSDCRTYTKDFLQQMVNNVWGVVFDSVSLTDVIHNERVKDFLSKAEQELRTGNYTEAVVNAMAGFQWALSKVRRSIVGATPKGVDAFMMLDYNEPKPNKEIFESFKEIQTIAFQSLIGLDHVGCIKYKRITRLISVSIMSDGQLSVNLGRDVNATDAGDIDFVINFAINSVIKIESLVGDIEDPFGHENGGYNDAIRIACVPQFVPQLIATQACTSNLYNK